MSLPPIRWRRAAWSACLALVPWVAAAQSLPAGYVPYKDVQIGLDPATARIALPAGRPEVVLAFAGGACGDERWGAVDGATFAAANVPALVRAGQRYWVSTGGAEARFTCDRADGLRAFVARHDSPLLQGLDFDIERDQTPEEIDALVRTVATVARERPGLRWMFTLATLAGSDGHGAGLNATGEAVMAALRRHGLDQAIVNLMVMDYGPGTAANCVPRTDAPRCDMARSALQAQRLLAARHGWPAARTALTPMLGVNDVTDNVFGPDDAAWLLREARAAGLAGLFAWSLDRDGPCSAGEPLVSPRCHGLPGLPRGHFLDLR
jgi:hypothetical protein